LAATAKNLDAVNQIYNVAVGQRTSLNKLYKLIAENLALHRDLPMAKLSHRDFRTGDVHHSLADISKAQMLLGYSPAFDIVAGISEAMPWYIGNVASL